MDYLRKLLEIKILSHTIFSNEKNIQNNTTIKILYFIDEYDSATPALLMSKLGLNKSNLANICKMLISEDLITSKKGLVDKRSVCYSITEKGKLFINKYLIELKNLFFKDEEFIALDESIDTIVKFLNKKI